MVLERRIGIQTKARPALAEARPAPGTFYQWSKRSLDVAAAGAVLLLLSPLLLVISVLIKLDSKGPVVFRQQRVGWKGRLFTLYKFRSMYDGVSDAVHREYFCRYANGEPCQRGNGASQDAYYVVADHRVTRVGTWLRRTCLDELPQLVNVLRGDMSLVGPRPAIPYELAVYKDWHFQRFAVTPGLTGLWQVKGRGIVPFDDMVAMDVEYIQRRSLALDIKLISATIPGLLKGRFS